MEVLGRVSDATLSSLYRGAHALVMPSLYEGFGLPVVEALAHGVPAIVSRDSALSEVAGKAGFHVDPLSHESICAALCVLTQQADTYAALQEQTTVRASAFSWEQSAVTMYEILCGRP